MWRRVQWTGPVVVAWMCAVAAPVALSLVEGCASKNAIDEGTCADDELAELQQICISAGCSYSAEKSASGVDTCGADANVVSQSGSVECSLEGSGSCSVVCSCDEGGAAACAQWGWNDCVVGRPPRGEELKCTGTLWAAYENAYCLCEEEQGMVYCEYFR